MTRDQEARRARAEARKARLEQAAHDSFDRVRQAVAHIPPGQPILVGHYSEKRHRRDLARSDAAMSRGVELAQEARKVSPDLAGRAVLGSDPEAVQALQDKLTALEAERDAAKACNRAFKRDPVAALAALPEELRPYAARSLRFGSDGKPFPPYRLTNLGAEIRRVKARIAELERKRAAEPKRVEGDGYTIEEDPDEDRIRLSFDTRLSREDFQAVRRLGFRWSREHEAFSRHLNNAGRYAVQQAIKLVLGLEVTL